MCIYIGLRLVLRLFSWLVYLELVLVQYCHKSELFCVLRGIPKWEIFVNRTITPADPILFLWEADNPGSHLSASLLSHGDKAGIAAKSLHVVALTKISAFDTLIKLCELVVRLIRGLEL